jgi:hypothetical protein
MAQLSNLGYLADNQYQYSVAYLEAIEAITGKHISEAIVLTESEGKEIQRQAGNDTFAFYHWALWMQRKLKMKEGPTHRPRQAIAAFFASLACGSCESLGVLIERVLGKSRTLSLLQCLAKTFSLPAG